MKNQKLKFWGIRKWLISIRKPDIESLTQFGLSKYDSQIVPHMGTHFELKVKNGFMFFLFC